jgi:hypothetical protein
MAMEKVFYVSFDMNDYKRVWRPGPDINVNVTVVAHLVACDRAENTKGNDAVPVSVSAFEVPQERYDLFSSHSCPVALYSIIEWNS